MLKKENKNLLLNVCNIAIEAGIIINEFFNLKNDIFYKKDKSPVTKADLASNSLIIHKLKNDASNLPTFSEESPIRWESRKKWKKYWLIDPLDGTKEFINQNKDFTVNIALIEKNLPILGVIYAPALSLLYFAEKDLGSYKLMTNKKIISLKGSKKLNSNKKNYSDTIKIIGSRSHPSKELDTWLKKNFKNYEIIKRGSSIKFCEIAEGKADIYPRFGPTSEWDIAAGQVILEQSGGSLKDFNNQKILYNYKESVINPPFIAQCKIFN